MRDHRLDAQASIEIRRQQRVYPSYILVAAFYAVMPSPERDHRDQPRFLIRNHHQASGETGYVFERTGDDGWYCGFHAVRFLGLGHKFNTQSGQRGGPRFTIRRLSFQPGSMAVSVTDTVCYIGITYRTVHQSSIEMTHAALQKGGASSPVQGRAWMRPLGHMGTGEGSPRIRTPERTGGSYAQV